MGSFYTHRILLLVAIYSFATAYSEEGPRDGKLSIFQVVKFQNSVCTGSSRNGTCFTAAECSDLGGTQDTTCADGFGVCCVVTLGTDGTSSVNNTYIVQTSSDLTSGSHVYTICPCSDDICRIRYDFTSFILNGPVSVSTLGVNAGHSASLSTGVVGSVGDCAVDQFTISATRGTGSPLVCGTLTGDHMIVDSNGVDCSKVNLNVGGTSSTRALEIKVTQYRCGEEMGGPPNCLQWITGQTSGRVKNYNFPDLTPGTNVPSNTVHLSNQDYQICIRRETGMEYICYITCRDVAPSAGTTANTAETAQETFGISESNAAIAVASIGTRCSTDYITIPGAGLVAIASASGISSAPEIATKFCGRLFGTAQDIIATVDAISLCTNSVPYKVGVHFDDDEKCSALASGANCEIEVAPGGITGFALCWTQTSNG